MYIKLLFQTFILAITSFLTFIFPVSYAIKWAFLVHLGLNQKIILTLLFTISTLYYFKTKTKFRPLKILVAYATSIGFISLICLCCILSVNIVTSLSNQLNLILLIVSSSLLTLYGKYNSKKIAFKHITLRSSKVITPHNFVFISDVHIGTQNSQHLEKIVQHINEINPDFLLIGGDLIDSSATTLNDLIALKSLKMPIYFITGNHEYYLKHSEDILNKLHTLNIKWLNNTSIPFKELCIAGINDNLIQTEKHSLIKKLQHPTNYTISVVHKPSSFDSTKKHIDLMLCGHTHNGQIFPFNLLVPLFFRQSYGLYTYKKATLYVSSGAGTWATKMRLGSSNEIVVFKLLPTA